MDKGVARRSNVFCTARTRVVPSNGKLSEREKIVNILHPTVGHRFQLLGKHGLSGRENPENTRQPRNSTVKKMEPSGGEPQAWKWHFGGQCPPMAANPRFAGDLGFP